VPLRSFGQLKQFFDKRDTPQTPGEAADSGTPDSPSPSPE
jgi:hypothetical protein